MQAVKSVVQEAAAETAQKTHVVFKNRGLIDVRAITTFGLSAKDSSNPNPIGYFGTGLKYAIAVILRNGLSIKICSGLDEFTFRKSSEFFRGKKVDIIRMEGTAVDSMELPFTTELGKNWDLWQAFRELYSNCLDEYGQTTAEAEMQQSIEGITQVIVTGEKFVELFENRSEIFLQGAPLVETPHVQVHGGASNNIFYRGIRVASFKEQLMYRYNITKYMDLTEDRTIKYHFQIRDSIVDSVLSSNDEKYIESILTAPEGSFESELDFTDNREIMSEEFRKVIASLRRRQPEKTNKKALDIFERTLQPEEKYEFYTPTEEETAALIKAIDFLAKLNISVDDYQIINIKSLGETTLAYVQSDKIYLSSRLYSMGTKQIASTLFEEWAHLKYGYQDCTRTMQTYLFDTVISLGERITGDIL